jgi:hypothetical protein
MRTPERPAKRKLKYKPCRHREHSISDRGSNLFVPVTCHLSPGIPPTVNHDLRRGRRATHGVFCRPGRCPCVRTSVCCVITAICDNGCIPCLLRADRRGLIVASSSDDGSSNRIVKVGGVCSGICRSAACVLAQTFFGRPLILAWC